ncbi:RimK/LysX family protein [Lutibacter sp. TH_r2]|uniref:ATP-dependent zinc protease family protein n=1 Tax=Lutibacter sp. TH_r2 TaxID=3082083 RepID=UPI0029556165|nr:RimK/LysX family protein [Lutibacter sp. TH_r2]MDV7186531.1 RimK/LysX family protein [Lutibacter sp. TH_r2]
MKTESLKKLLGRTDILDFPELELFGIDIKVDTGAYTSSFHCHHIELENNILKCQFLDPKHEKYHDKFFEFNEFVQKNVKSSNGITEERFIIKTNIIIFNEIHTIELSLTERGSMTFPVLLGRKFLSKKFIIDTAKKNLSFKKLNKTS